MTTPPSPDRSPRRGLGCLLLTLVGLVAAFVLYGLLSAMGEPTRGVEITIESSPEAAVGTVVIVEARGVMMGGRSPQPGALSGDLHAALDFIEADDTVLGVLLRLDTPGGSVTDADLLHHRVGRLKDRGVKVLAQMGDLCASGGVYLASVADEIWALPTSVTGSIGVIINTLNFSALMAQLGVADTSVTSGEHKQLLSPTQPPSEADRAILQQIVDQMHQRFIKVVAEGRGWPVERVAPLADGRIFSAEQAMEVGLVDAIGYTEAAQERLLSMVGRGPLRVVKIRPQRSLLDLFSARLGVRDDGALKAALQGPRAMYMLAPGLRW